MHLHNLYQIWLKIHLKIHRKRVMICKQIWTRLQYALESMQVHKKAWTIFKFAQNLLCNTRFCFAASSVMQMQPRWFEPKAWWFFITCFKCIIMNLHWQSKLWKCMMIFHNLLCLHQQILNQIIMSLHCFDGMFSFTMHAKGFITLFDDFVLLQIHWIHAAWSLKADGWRACFFIFLGLKWEKIQICFQL